MHSYSGRISFELRRVGAKKSLRNGEVAGIAYNQAMAQRNFDPTSLDKAIESFRRFCTRRSRAKQLQRYRQRKNQCFPSLCVSSSDTTIATDSRRRFILGMRGSTACIFAVADVVV
jgi:hypothetical protein